MTHRVSVALCTYNGKQFLSEQLSSLARQTQLPDELVVCDDCSTDGTVTLLKRFAETAPFLVRIEVNNERLGPVANFGKAAGFCGGDIVLFCDQDDVWNDDKIELEVNAILEAEREIGTDTPVLVHCDLEVVDRNLVSLHPSFMRLTHPKFGTFGMSYMLEDNVAVGCATAVNRALLEIALPLPRQALMHDWWFAQCATVCGRVIYVDRPLMRYRQHSDNQIGASSWLSRLAAGLRSPGRRWRASLASLRATIEQAKALDASLANMIGLDRRKMEIISAYAGLLDVGPATKAALVLRHGYGRSGRLGTLWFLLKAFFA